jgi:hypothetical protein
VSDLTYRIEDPRPRAAEAPYTFSLPAPEELSALAPDDYVKLIFVSVPTSNVERMWVMIDAIDGDNLVGLLANEPKDMPGLNFRDTIAFSRHAIIACQWGEDRDSYPTPPPPNRTYWERCLVDRCVIDEGVRVHFLYREEPQPTSEDDDPDSGWAIRGDYRGLSKEELDARETAFVALGLVLNRDDSWLHLIDEPIGSAFIRDWESGEFVPEESGGG